jgi:peroxiredoxin
MMTQGAVDGTFPRWMKLWLIAAGVYNLLWGTVVIALPGATLEFIGLEMVGPARPLWQCIGMIVGVYGIGYLIAASNALRHWPIVLVGLLGKVLGPVGFAGGLITGDLPLRMGLTILTNDLLWWIPFTMILWHATKHHMAGGVSETVERAEDVMKALRTSDGRTVWDASQESPLLLVLLRHMGCTFCREAMAELAEKRGEIERSGARIVLVHMSPESDAKAMTGRYGLGDVMQVSDVQRRLYRSLELGRGSLWQLFSPVVWWRGFMAAIVRGHGVGKLEGDGFQMPGVFLIHRGRVVKAFRHRHASDQPDYCELSTGAGA